MRQIMYYVALTMLGLSVFLPAQQPPELSDKLAPLQMYVGKTWKGKVGSSDGGGAVYDIARWERALNGKGIRIVHSVNDGDYGGETMIIWDSAKDLLVFYYFTTEGFYTSGTVSADDGRMIVDEQVSGNADGITAVKSTTEMGTDGRMYTSSQFLQNGEWTEPRVTVYEEAPEALVIFK